MSEFKLKKKLVREWKCSGNINSLSGYQYKIFTRTWCNIDGSISQNTDDGSGSEAEKHKFQDVSKSEFSWLIYDSNNYVMFAERQAQILLSFSCLAGLYYSSQHPLVPG
jgi:hypothetical protein